MLKSIYNQEYDCQHYRAQPANMAVNIDLNQETLKGKLSEGCDVQFVPCKIEHDGEAEVEKFFNTYVREEKNDEEGKEEKVLKGTLRGYPLSGCVIDVPKGYTGIVLKETRPTLNSEESRTMRVISQFKQFTYWNWDREPSRGDKYQQAMDWAEIADVIHGSE
ncbi:uncharacterized protein [Penaeus vannamei]|uniref:uncharacterized protein isoform X2 n=1 Tax=Penaeus vannamei TaxID=6689 RepID=UPI000F6716A6|nr:ribonuclease H2 subunit C-like isoform X1 [Penaeus vannamei]